MRQIHFVVLPHQSSLFTRRETFAKALELWRAYNDNRLPASLLVAPKDEPLNTAVDAVLGDEKRKWWRA